MPVAHSGNSVYCTGGFAMMNINKRENELREPDVLQEHDGGSAGTPDAGVSEALEEHRLTQEEIEQLKEQASKATENWNQMLRVAADFENFKKRAARERQDISKYANESLLQKLIPVLDNFDNALAAANTAQNSAVEQLQT